jgi:hypothetical protein
LGGKGFDDGVPAAFKGLDALFKLLILALPCARFQALVLLFCLERSGGRYREEGDASSSAESSVLLFELGYSAFKVRVLGLAAVS